MMKFQKILSVVLFTTLTVGMLMLTVSCLSNNDDSGHKNPVDPGATPTPSLDIPGWTLVVNDTLQNTADPGGRTLSGGRFEASGFFIEEEYHGYILYQTNIIQDMIVEFDAVGYKSAEYYVREDDEFSIIQIHDAPVGTNWKHPSVWPNIPNWWYRMFKMANWPGGAASYDGLKLKAGSCYYVKNQYCGWESKSWQPAKYPGFNSMKYSWDRNTVYHWKFEINDGDLWVYRNGEKIYEMWSSFRPQNPYNVYIGGSDMGHLSPDGVTYSNVRIYRRS